MTVNGGRKAATRGTTYKDRLSGVLRFESF